MYGLDYAFYPHPGISQLKAAGVKFVCRYLSPVPANDANGKNLIPSEAAALKAAGLAIVVVFETYAGRMREGRAAGVADAQHSDAVVNALGMAGLPVYFAADWDATPGDQTAINAYLDGVASVIGRARTGIYGGYYPVKRALDAGKATWAWQTIAWSGGQWDARVHIRQGLSVQVGPAQCDRDDSMKADFGQWPRPAPANVYAVNPVAGLAAAVRYTQADISWKPSAHATGYRIIWRLDGGGAIIGRIETAGATAALRNLSRGTRYQVSVLALPASPSASASGRARIIITTRK